MTTAALPRRNGRHTAGPTPPEEGWTPTGCPRPDSDPFLQQRISVRLPAAAASHTEVINAKGDSDDPAWWQTTRRSSSIDAPPHQHVQSHSPAFTQGCGTAAAVWTDGSVGLEQYNARGALSTSSNMAKASYMSQPPPFGTEDRLEIFNKRVGGFGADQSAPGGGEATWRGGQGAPTSVAPAAGGGLEAWSSTYGGISDPGAAGMPWARQGGVGGHQDLRQVREGGPESVSGPSQRLHEMKEYFRRHQRAPPETHEPHRYPFFDGTILRPRPGAAAASAYDNRREDGMQEQGNGGEGGGGSGESGGGGGGGGAANGSVPRHNERMPWQDGANSYTTPVSTTAPDTPQVNPPAVGIVSVQGGDGGDAACGRAWRVGNNPVAGAAGASVATAAEVTSGGASGSGTGGSNGDGDVGGEFDPQGDCKPAHSGQMTAGGSPSSWWRDVPEPVVSTFPWDLQLPNPAPPLALSHAPIDIRELPDSSNAASGGGGGAPPPPGADPSSSSCSSALRGGAPDHSSLCRCDSCRFGKIIMHPRHRPADQRLQQSSALDIIDGGGGGGGGGGGSGGGIRSGSGAVLMDAAARGSYGGLRWGVNPPPSAAEVAWATGGRNGGGVGGGLGSYLTNRKLDDMRRGNAPSCDTLVPPGPHTPAYNVVPLNPRGVLQATGLGGGGHERFAQQDFKPLSLADDGYSADGMSFGARDARAKRARIPKREARAGGEPDFGQRMDRGGGRGASGGSVSRDSTSGGGAKASKGKKAPASSRRCRHEACQSHPNFGVEGDRRAIYCAKHKLQGMVNVKAPRCREPSCTRNPVYGHAGDPRATFCLTHKGPLMVDVKNRCCEHPGCKHQPSFGLVGDRRANFCFAHKLPTHVNIRRARARAS